MAGKKKQGNARRKARFQSGPERVLKNKRRRWDKRRRKMERKAEKRGEVFDAKFGTYDEERKASQEASAAAKKRR